MPGTQNLVAAIACCVAVVAAIWAVGVERRLREIQSNEFADCVVFGGLRTSNHLEKGLLDLHIHDLDQMKKVSGMNGDVLWLSDIMRRHLNARREQIGLQDAVDKIYCKRPSESPTVE